MPAVLDPRTPVIVGAGQWSNRVDQGDEPVSPVAMMAEAARRAAHDAGAPDALRSLEAVRVVRLLSWRYRDPARLVADALDCPQARSGLTAMGGNAPQSLINRTADQIQRGELDAALVCGGEAWRTRKDLIRRDERPAWTVQDDDVAPDERFGTELSMTSDAETAVGLMLPIQMYAIFDHAIRIAAGRTIAEQRRLIGTLWSRFSSVAAANPHAWNPEQLTPDEVIDPGPGNRLVGHPYTKAVNSYEWVDQSAALLMCAAARADALGIPRDRWVFPVAGADCTDGQVSEREELHRSPSMAAAGRAVLNAAGIGVHDLGIIDLYSCFPSAVQMAAAELGLDLERDLTVTGGMSRFGGPWNDYVTHSVATTVDRLRAEPETIALCTGNGGYADKQSFGIYAARPPAGGFRLEESGPQAESDRATRRAVAAGHDGTATMEAWTVMHDRDGEPEAAMAAALTPDGARTWATSTHPDTMAALMAGELDRSRLEIADGAFTPTVGGS
jgi:acetyl-CoA C-acetyltransferase